MTDNVQLQSATQLAVTIAWLAGAAVGAYLLGIALSWALHRIGRRSELLNDVAILTRWSVRATLVMIATVIAVDAATDASAPWRRWVDHLLLILLIAAITWLVASLVLVAERRAITRFGGGDQVTDADLQRRRIRTQVTTLRRLTIAIVVLLGIAAALRTFPEFEKIGTTMFASAGVLSVIAGLAAQTALGSVFAGMQIAFSGAIRVGDVVVVEGEWGRIEEITLTHVVVQIWDLRRLVLPTTYFTTKPFQNWTRNATQLLGTVELDIDFTVPLDEMRAELDRQLANNDQWDGRASAVQATDAVGGYFRVRILVSAPDSSTLWNLRCDVREGLVDWLQRNYPGALPHWRVEESRARTVAAADG